MSKSIVCAQTAKFRESSEEGDSKEVGAAISGPIEDCIAEPVTDKLVMEKCHKMSTTISTEPKISRTVTAFHDAGAGSSLSQEGVSSKTWPMAVQPIQTDVRAASNTAIYIEEICCLLVSPLYIVVHHGNKKLS